MMELLLISPKFQRYVKDIGIEARIRQVLHITELERYMHIYENIEISDIDGLLVLTKGSMRQTFVATLMLVVKMEF